ncbi:MAG TPA: hypothetical protein VK137_11440 [Planctomycetaceae bacterium]|nr:hypothetical protein [Planctomycetaceae bacterium]
MATVRDWLRAVEPFANVRHQHRMSDNSQGALPVESSPDMVIVCQSWPDEFSASDVSTSLGRWPLALWVCCFGSWCESDGRTRAIWPIGVRVPARAAVSRLTQLWEIVAHRRNAPLPITASRDEAFEFDSSLRNAATQTQNTLRGRTVLIRSPDSALRQWLSDLAAALGASASIGVNDELPTGAIVFWDVDPDWQNASQEIARLLQRRSDVRVVALAGLAHPEFVTSLRAMGVDVVTKVSATAQLQSLFDANNSSG